LSERWASSFDRPAKVGVAGTVVDEIRAGYPCARIDVETAGRLTGEWDPARIEQALSNLLANAVQHGGSNVRLVASGEDQEAVVVTVRNGGDPFRPSRDGDEHLSPAFPSV
jgi:signal transduction histidine kinase